jgi:tRNA-binding EMAP/Myf-like protein
LKDAKKRNSLCGARHIHKVHHFRGLPLDRVCIQDGSGKKVCEYTCDALNLKPEIPTFNRQPAAALNNIALFELKMKRQLSSVMILSFQD